MVLVAGLFVLIALAGVAVGRATLDLGDDEQQQVTAAGADELEALRAELASISEQMQLARERGDRLEDEVNRLRARLRDQETETADARRVATLWRDRALALDAGDSPPDPARTDDDAPDTLAAPAGAAPDTGSPSAEADPGASLDEPRDAPERRRLDDEQPEVER